MTYAFILFAMSVLVPQRDHTELARAVSTVVEDSEPLFRGDEDKRKTAALLVAVAYRESSFRNDAIGDHGRARCAMQLWAAPREVLTDPELCTRIALERLRESLRACGMSNVLGLYAAGAAGCTSERAKRISRDRMWLAKRVLGER